MPPTLILKCLELDNNMNLRAFIQKLHGAMEDQPGGQLHAHWSPSQVAYTKVIFY